MKKLVSVLVLGLLSSSFAFGSDAHIGDRFAKKIIGSTTIFPTQFGVQTLTSQPVDLQPVGDQDMVALPVVSTIINLLFGLHGCMDSFGDMTYYIDRSSDAGKLHIYVAGQNLSDERSTRVRCFVMPAVVKSIHVSGYYTKDDIVLHDLNVVKAKQPVLPIHPIRPPVTCMAYFSGAQFDSTTKACKMTGKSGCSNPFEFLTVEECNEAHGVEG